MNCILIKILLIILNEFVLSLCSTMSPYLGPLRTNVSMKIVSGLKARRGDFPYQVSFKKGGPVYRNFCGGSIIKPKIVVSAAHCFTTESKGVCASVWRGKSALVHFSDMHVVAASLKNSVKESTPSYVQWRTIQDVKYPDEYEFPENDIAIIIVNREWNFNQYVAPISTAVRFMDYTHMSCVASGYGRTETGEPARVLMYAFLTVISVKKCNELRNLDTLHFVCTGKMLNSVHKGDSGGPLVCRNTKDPNERTKDGVLVGITSAGSSYFDMFTRVTSFRRFIESNDSNIIKPTITMLLIVFINFII